MANLLIVVIFVVCLIYNLWAVSVGWSNTILDMHGFRQSQTAISAYWLLRGGPWLAYETPVLGAPWSIPFEFPLYQWTVAMLAALVAIPLDQAGRLVSLGYFYASFVPVYYVLGTLKVRPVHRLVFLALLLVSPQYIFWSRTFMIESAAVFFGACYLAATARYFRSGTYVAASLAAVCGVLGGTVKATTLAGFMLASAVLALQWWRQHRPGTRVVLLSGIVLFGLPLVGTRLWTQFADAQKAANPLAVDFIQSATLRQWNFGTLGQRLDSALWIMIFRRAIPDVLGHQLPWCISLAAACLAPRRWKEVVVCSGLFVAPMLIFTNLYIIHNYYAYANGLFLVAAVGFTIVSLLERTTWRAGVGLTLLGVTVATAAGAYYQRFYPVQATDHVVPFATALQTVTQPDDVLLIYGADWSSAIAYYAKRRALMDRDSRDLNEPHMRAALEQLRGYRIGAALFCDDARNRQDLAAAVQRKFHLSSRYAAPGCHIYLAEAADPREHTSSSSRAE